MKKNLIKNKIFLSYLFLLFLLILSHFLKRYNFTIISNYLNYIICFSFVCSMVNFLILKTLILKIYFFHINNKIKFILFPLENYLIKKILKKSFNSEEYEILSVINEKFKKMFLRKINNYFDWFILLSALCGGIFGIIIKSFL